MMIIKDKNKLISFMVVAFIVVAWMEKGNSHHSFFLPGTSVPGAG